MDYEGEMNALVFDVDQYASIVGALNENNNEENINW